MTPRTSAGLLKFRPVRSGSRVALVAPASPFDRAAFEAGVAELLRLDLDPVYDDSVFEREEMVAGPAQVRANALAMAWRQREVDAILAVRGGYGSVEVLPYLDAAEIRASRTAFVGYSDVTSVHSFLGSEVGLASVHGPMIDGRLSNGPSAYDPVSFLQALGSDPLGELAPDGLEVLRPGEAVGPMFGGTLTQLVASLGTPFAFAPPEGYVLFLDEVSERPYRLRRMLVQLQFAGLLADAAAVVFGQLPRCDEPGELVTARATVADCLAGFRGPVLFGFPSGHTTTPLVTLPFGVRTRVIANDTPRVIVEESAAE